MLIFHDQIYHMAKIYTKNTIIQLLYGECDLFETLEIENALSEDLELQTEYFSLKQSMAIFKTEVHKPKSEAIRNILTYSKSLPAHC